MSVKVNFNPSAVVDKVLKKIHRVQKKLDAQILKDSNYFCPMDTGSLKKSAIVSSVLGSGDLIWNTTYAKAQYYGYPNKNKQTNPNARGKWFEAAKAVNLSKWEKLVNDEYSKDSK